MKQIVAALIISGGIVAHALISAPTSLEGGQIVNPFTKTVTGCNFEKGSCTVLNMTTGEVKTIPIKKE